MPAASIFLNPGFFATYAVLQAIVLLLLFRLLDAFEPVPLPIVFLLAAWGASGAALLALVGNEAVNSLLPADARDVFGDAVAPPVVEELAKGIALVVAVLLSRRILRDTTGWQLDGPVAGFVCGAAVGIGFSFTEDFFYFVNHTTSQGIKVGADIYLGRRDFFGPTALHHSLFTGAFGAGIGIAAWSRARRLKLVAPFAGLTIAIGMHAINNGLVELILTLRYGLDSATAWVNDLPVSSSVSSTADLANTVLTTLDYAYVALFIIGALLWQRRARKTVAGALEEDVAAGFVEEADVEAVTKFGGRTRLYAGLLLSGQFERVLRLRAYYRQVGGLGMARWRVSRGLLLPTSVPEHRRAVLASQGPMREPGRVDTPELAILGRGSELERLMGLAVDGSRQITITGPGGVGKTRVALELASRLGGQMAHGAFFVDLSSVTTADEVGPAISSVLGVELPGGEEPGAWLGRLLSDREVLLVLDNFEQVAQASSVVTNLVRSSPRLRVAVTSRVVLGIPGETEFRLDPLPTGAGGQTPSSAAALFIDRAKRAGGKVEEPKLALIESICRRLDGLPLAIELVAARTRSLPLEALASRLDESLELAETGGKGVTPRQRTLRGAIRWSEELLEAPERDLWLALAQFPGGCRLDGIQQAGEGTNVLKGLRKLVDNSLLRMELDPDGEPRYRMLATVRDFAMERVQQEDEIHAVVLPADYYEAIVSSIDLAEPWSSQLYEILDRERANILTAVEQLRSRSTAAALQVVVSLGLLWERAAGEEIQALLDLLLKGDDLPPRLRGQGRRQAARLALLRGEYESAEGLLLASLTDAGDDPELRFACNWDLGWIAMFRGRFDAAETAFIAALTDGEAADSLRARGSAMIALGRARAEQGNTDSGAELIERSTSLCRAIDDERGEISAISTSARISLLSGDLQASLEGGQEAAARSRKLHDRLREAEALYTVCYALLLLGRVRDAANAGTSRLRLCAELGDRLGIAEMLDLCSLLLGAAGEAHRAGEFVNAATKARDAIGAQRWPWDQRLLTERNLYGFTINSQSIQAPSLGQSVSRATGVLEELRDQVPVGVR